jgi:hypothetical protein
MESKYEIAFKAMCGYYDGVVSRMADEVVEKSSEIGHHYLGRGEDIVDRYGHQLMLVSRILCDLKARVPVKPAQPAPPPQIEQLRCAPGGVADTLKQWFSEHPGIVPSHLQVLQEKDECICLIVHSGAKKKKVEPSIPSME